MLKLPTLLALFICLVYSNNEHNVESETPSSELHILKKQHEDSKNTFETIKGHYVEEKQRTKPCKEKKNRRQGSEDTEELDVFESLPLSATLEQVNTASIGDKVVTSSVRGGSYNNKKEITDRETENDLQNKNCDCENCVTESNKKVLQFDSLALDSKSNAFNNAPVDINTPDVTELANKDNTLFNKALEESRSEDIKNIPPVSAPLELNIDDSVGEPVNPCNKGLKMNTRRTKCGRISLSEDLSNKPSTRRILPGIINNPNNQELQENKLYQDGPQFTQNDMGSQQKTYGNLALPDKINNPINRNAEDYLLYQGNPQLNPNDELGAENRHNYFPNVKKVTNSYDIDLVKNMNVNEGPQQLPPLESSVESQLMEPTIGKGIYDMKETGVMLLENSRVCYACSTLTDPTCWTPDRKTTVKYCRKGHKSCLTKSFKHRGKAVIIRDCGSYCVNSPSGDKNYNSCSICHSDFCNGAASMKIYSVGIGIIAFFGILLNTH